MKPIKWLALSAILLAMTAVVGIAACKAMGAKTHVREMLLAEALAFVAALIAVIPLFAQQGRLDTAGAFQAALMGSVLHLGIVLLAAIVLLVLKQVSTAFVLWLLGAYWATLIALCITFAKAIQSAPKVVTKGN